MNHPIFNREVFALCRVPVPKGYPQSQTHSGIAYVDGRYYLTTSPYPVRQYPRVVNRIRSLFRKISRGRLCNPARPETYENPCLYVGYATGAEPPVSFVPMSSRPLMDTPDSLYGFPAYNSDPDIFVEKDRVYVMNRIVYPTEMHKRAYKFVTFIYLIHGQVFHDKLKLVSTQLVKEGAEPYISPCLTKYRNQYVFTHLDATYTVYGSTFNGLYLQVVDSMEELSQNNSYRSIRVKSGDLHPWHMSLFCHKDRLYSIIACVRNEGKPDKIWQMLGEFDERLTELTIYPTPLTDYNSYRGSACVREDGMFVLYSTTVWEHVEGSKSVDGRDIVMVHCPFSELISRLKKESCNSENEIHINT